MGLTDRALGHALRLDRLDDAPEGDSSFQSGSAASPAPALRAWGLLGAEFAA
jgi:hypothetical protein